MNQRACTLASPVGGGMSPFRCVFHSSNRGCQKTGGVSVVRVSADFRLGASMLCSPARFGSMVQAWFYLCVLSLSLHLHRSQHSLGGPTCCRVHRQ